MSSTATIAFAGNPNSGKTTLFNALTGARQRVGNYPGITVERKEGHFKFEDVKVNVIDLPGCYSLSAYSAEELVARKVLVDERPDIVVDIVDATKLKRHLYLAVQLFELGVPVALALNMIDDAKKQGLHINTRRLSGLLGCPVVETAVRSGQGKQELTAKALAHAQKRGGVWEPLTVSYGPDIDPALKTMSEKIEAAIRHSVAGRIGTFFEPVSQLAGFDWRTNIALVGGFAAKEVIVSSFGTAYSLGEVDPEAAGPLSARLAADPTWTKYTAIALIVFVLLYAPCFVTVVTMAKESSWRWALFSTVFNTTLGFMIAVLVYQIGSALA